MEQVTAEPSRTAVYEQLDSYDWDNDNEFQGGLRAILNSAPPDQAPRLIVRAKCYYFARKFKSPVDFDGYLHWTQTHATLSNGASNPVSTHQDHLQQDVITTQNVSQPTASPMGNAPPPASFAEICELIAEGKPIPGIKDIPDTVLEGQATQSQAVRRKKPWEKDAAPAPTPSWARSG